MSPFIEYLIKMSLGLTVTSLFYHLVLSRFTFYNWNRWYLLGYSALAFVIPFINVDRVLKSTQLANSSVVQVVPSISHFAYIETVARPVSAQQTNLSLGEILSVIFILGVIVLVVRFGIQAMSYFKMMKDSELISDEEVRIYHSKKKIIPFSFGNAIFINPSLHSDSDLKDITLHEFIHVKQKHTFDILFGELLCILNWYNPFAWLIRHAIRQNLEYIADRAVLGNGIDMKQYQYLLLKVVGAPEFRIANQFNFSSLKQRIIMMNKMKSARIHLIQFLFVLPLLAVLMMSFRNDLSRLIDDKMDATSNIGKMSKGKFYIAGIVIDAVTGLPVKNLEINFNLHETDFDLPDDGKNIEHALDNMVVKERMAKTIITDNDGFYFYDLDLKGYSDNGNLTFTLSCDDKYKGFGMASAISSLNVKEGLSSFEVSFLSKRSLMEEEESNEMPSFPYRVDSEEFFANNSNADVKSDLKKYLLKKKSKISVEYNLKVAFRKANPAPKDIITKFGNGYFDQGRRLVGYESQTQFYLDGKKSDYQEINDAFKDKDVAGSFFRSSNPFLFEAANKEMCYYTFPLHKSAPPVYLLKNNFETLDVNKFDTTTLDKEAYFLDGFRQTYGIGSNLKPLKSEMKRVILFKGNLAKYYDQKLDKIWWIETRPESEVYERPDLATK